MRRSIKVYFAPERGAMETKGAKDVEFEETLVPPSRKQEFRFANHLRISTSYEVRGPTSLGNIHHVLIS